MTYHIVVDNALIAVLIAGAIGLITALTKTLRLLLKRAVLAQHILVASTEAQLKTNEVQAQSTQAIHVLVNHRFLTVLRVLVVVTKKEAERTHDIKDIEVYNTAQAELDHAEEANLESLKLHPGSPQAEAYDAVERLVALLKTAKPKEKVLAS